MISEGIADLGSPVMAQPMNRPSSPRRPVTAIASSSELRRFCPIWS